MTATLVQTCAQCRADFTSWRRDLARFCSRSCAGAWRHDHPEPRPFSLDPVLSLVDGYIGRGANQYDAGHTEHLAVIVARCWGVSWNGARQRIGRWRRLGLTTVEADRLAVAFGYHPANLWPQWWHVDELEGV